MSIFTYILTPNFGASKTGQKTNLVAKIYDSSTQTLQATVASGWSEQLDAAGNAVTGAYRNSVSIDLAWLPAEVRYTITGLAGVWAGEKIGDVRSILTSPLTADGKTLITSGSGANQVIVDGEGGMTLAEVVTNDGHLILSYGNMVGQLNPTSGNVVVDSLTTSGLLQVSNAIWNALTSTMTLAGSIGKFLLGLSAGGTGTWPITIKVTSDGTTPISGATVRFSAGGQVLTGTTNSSGIVAFTVNPATFTLSILANFFTYTATTQVIDGSGHFANGTALLTVTMTPVAIPTPPAPGQTTGFCHTRDLSGNAIPNVSVIFQLKDAQQATDVYPRDEQTFTSDSNGLLTVTLLQNASYTMKTANGKMIPFTTGSSSTYALPEVIGKYSS